MYSTMKPWVGVLLGLCILSASAGSAPRAQEIRQVRLENGLTVILRRVEGAPLVSVWIGIHAGSANECPGITGAAHWCEHMAFKGTERYGRDQMKDLIERAGGAWNGYTWLDQTGYFETLPSGALDLALDIEAQRMTASLFLPEAVESERSVIISELQMGENDPENLLDIETTAAAFTAHPYRWPTIGWQSDIEKMTRDDLYRFYRCGYCPANATLVVAGEFDEDRTLQAIRTKFGAIPAGELLERLRTVEPEQRGERRVRIERGGTTAYLELLYHTPAIDSEDFIPLLVLNAALGGADGITLHGVDWRGQASRSSRLYRGLVDKGIAAKAGSLYLPTKYPCVFSVYATAGQGVELARLEQETVRLIGEVVERGLGEAEFQKAVNGLRARFVYDCDGVSGQAHMLGFFETLGDAAYPWSFLKKLGRVRQEEVKTVAAKYFGDKNRTVGWYVPTGGAGGGAARSAPPRVSGGGRGPAGYRDTGGDAAATPAPAPRRLPLIHLWGWKKDAGNDAGVKPGKEGGQPGIALNAVRTVLPNGLTLIVRENHGSPSIAARVDVTAGSAYDPAGKSGLANFTARMLDRGTGGMSASLISEVIDTSGTEIEVSCGRDRASLSARMLGEKLPLVAELLSQMLREPVFPAPEMEKLRGRIITQIEEAAQDTAEVAGDRAYELIYPYGHPYRHRIAGDLKSVRALRREDLIDFFTARYTPRATTIVLSGDIAPGEAATLVEKHFGTWDARGSGGGPTLLAPPLPLETKWEKAKIPDKSQVDIAIGCRGVARDNPDYYALQVMNTVLGRFGMGGRLGRVIREDRGLAYYVSSAFVPYRGAGPFLVRAGVNPKNVDEAVREIRNGILKMKNEGVTNEELAESREYLVNSLPRMIETNAGVADALADAEFYRLGLDYFARYPGLIGGVTAKDVRRVANDYLYPDNLAIVLAGPVD
ncbi:MAG: pitrilysin family protein [Chlamydiota bacterium]